MRATLANHDVGDFDTEDLISLMQGKHYQVACTRYYEVTRAKMLNMSTDNLRGGLSHEGVDNLSKESIEHPNQFFEQSFLLIKSRQNKDEHPETVDELQPTVKGQYIYRKSGPQFSSNPDMEM